MREAEQMVKQHENKKPTKPSGRKSFACFLLASNQKISQVNPEVVLMVTIHKLEDTIRKVKVPHGHTIITKGITSQSREKIFEFDSNIIVERTLKNMHLILNLVEST